MKLAIIGAGNVGGTLGQRWAQNGHDVLFGVRQPQGAKVQEVLRSAGANAGASSIAEAVATALCVLLATPWAATQEALQAAGNLSGKILIDCTNPLAPGLVSLDKLLSFSFVFFVRKISCRAA